MIKSWHTTLIDQARERDRREGDAVEFMLRYLEKSVFKVAPGKRHGSREIKEKLSETSSKYQGLEKAGTDESLGGTLSK